VAKSRIQFICQNCGTVHSRWAGKCDSCGEWNTLVEEGTTAQVFEHPTSAYSRELLAAIPGRRLAGAASELVA
jgi:DNA repair protein RadA/Sms